MTQLLAIALVLLLTGLSLGGANLLRDRGAPTPVTRWLAAVVGGLAYLVATVWLDVFAALALASSGLLLMGVLRRRGGGALRGLRSDSAASVDRAELGYPAAAVVAMAVGWFGLHNPWLAFSAIAFMAWGDASAGLARGLVSSPRLGAAAASITMLVVAMGCAAVFYPTPGGFVAAVAATAAETLWPLTHSKVSDNWPVVASAMGSMAVCGGL